MFTLSLIFFLLFLSIAMFLQFVFSSRLLSIKSSVCKRTLDHLARPIWLNGWLFVGELSGCGFEFRCCHLNFRYRACFEQGVSWHLGVWIHYETRTSHNKSIPLFSIVTYNHFYLFIDFSYSFIVCLLFSFIFFFTLYSLTFLLTLLEIAINIW